MHGLMRGQWRSAQVHERAWVCKLPSEADRAEMLSLASRGNSPLLYSTVKTIKLEGAHCGRKRAGLPLDLEVPVEISASILG